MKKTKTYIDPTYQELFNEFNERFFDGRLRRYTIRVTRWQISIGDGVNAAGHIDRSARTIYLQQDSNEEMRGCLIHEMAHAATNDSHGPRFWAEIQRLARSGAPVNRWELDGPIEARLTRQRLEALAEDYFCDCPEDSVDHALTRIAREEFHVSKKSLIRSFPWVRKVVSAMHVEILQMIEAKKTTSRRN